MCGALIAVAVLDSHAIRIGVSRDGGHGSKDTPVKRRCISRFDRGTGVVNRKKFASLRIDHVRVDRIRPRRTNSGIRLSGAGCFCSGSGSGGDSSSGGGSSGRFTFMILFGCQSSTTAPREHTAGNSSTGAGGAPCARRTLQGASSQTSRLFGTFQFASTIPTSSRTIKSVYVVVGGSHSRKGVLDTSITVWAGVAFWEVNAQKFFAHDEVSKTEQSQKGERRKELHGRSCERETSGSNFCVSKRRVVARVLKLCEGFVLCGHGER